MRLRALPIALSATLCSAAATLLQAQAPNGFITVTQSRLLDVNGNPVANASVCATPSTSVKVANSGVTTMTQKCVQATNGAWTMFLPDGALSATLNAAFKITAIDNATRQQLLSGYDTVQPHSQTCSVVAGATTCTTNAANDWCQASGCNFDELSPAAPPNALIVQGTKGDPGAPGVPGPSGNTLAGTTSPEAYELSQGVTVTPGTTDEAPYIQECVNNTLYWCILEKRAYYLGSTLVLPDLAYLRGAGMTNGTRIYSHVNGPAITMAPGPNQGLHVGDFNLIVDPTLANSQGIVLEAQQAASLAEGGLWNSTFEHIEIDNCALQCMYTYTSGAAATINQFDTFNDITIQGPGQSHPAYLWQSIGANNQFDRYKVSVNGDDNNTDYPNALEYMGPDSTGSAPSDVGCVKCTYQGGTNAISLVDVRTYSQLAGYIENVATVIKAQTVYGLQFDWMDVRNSGYTIGVLFAEGGVYSGSFQHNTMDASATATQPQFGAFCVNANQIEIGYNSTNIGSAAQHGCDEAQYNTAASMLVYGTRALITGDSGATPIATLTDPQIGSDGLLTLKAFGGSIELASGGNIDFQGFPYPLLIPSGSSVTLRYDDLLSQWAIQSTTAAIPVSVKALANNAVYPSWTQNLIATGSGSTNGLTAGDLCTVSFRWDGSGANYNEVANCLGSAGNQSVWLSTAKTLGSESFTQVGGFSPGLPGVTKTCTTYPTVQNGIVTSC